MKGSTSRSPLASAETEADEITLVHGDTDATCADALAQAVTDAGLD